MPKFEKVSFEAFEKDVHNIYGSRYTREQIKEAYDSIRIPERADEGSAGYDLSAPFGFTLSFFKRRARIPTGVKAKFDKSSVLLVLPRSGKGVATGYHLTNTAGVIDSSYYGNEDNDGDIIVCLSYGHKKLKCAPGERFAQGVILKIDTRLVPGEAARLAGKKRKGGFGSTGK